MEKQCLVILNYLLIKIAEVFSLLGNVVHWRKIKMQTITIFFFFKTTAKAQILSFKRKHIFRHFFLLLPFCLNLWNKLLLFILCVCFIALLSSHILFLTAEYDVAEAQPNLTFLSSYPINTQVQANDQEALSANFSLTENHPLPL